MRGRALVNTDARRFNSKEDALDWMAEHQKARRNLTEAQERALRGRKYNAVVRKHGTNQYTRSSPSVNSSTEGYRSTSHKMGEALGVSHNTVHKDSRYAKELDVIAAVAPDLTADILAGKVSGARPHVAAAAEATKAGGDPREALRQAAEGAKPGPKVRVSRPVSRGICAHRCAVRAKNGR